MTENNEVTILWDIPVHADREIKANRPDIIIKDKKENMCMLIDVARNTYTTFTDKVTEYKEMEIEINLVRRRKQYQ